MFRQLGTFFGRTGYELSPGSFEIPAVPPSGNPRYFVRSDGTATKADAVDPNSAAGAMNLATFAASSFSPGDVIEFDGRGASDFGAVVINDGGAAGNPIYFVGSLQFPPKISVSTGIALSMLSNIDHIRIAHFRDIEQTGGDGIAVRIDPGEGNAVVDFEMRDVVVSRNRDAGSTATAT